MREAGFHDKIDVSVDVEPVEECIHALIDARCSRRLEVHALLANRAGNDLHRPIAVVSPRSYPNFAHTATPGGKKCRVPSKQSISGKRLVVVARRIEHHFDNAFDVAICRLERADIHSESSGNGGPHLFCVELFAFDIAALENICGQGLQYSFLAEIEAQSSHVAD